MVLARMSRPPRVVVLVLAGLLLLGIVLPPLLVPILADRIRHEAAARGLEAHWERLSFAWPQIGRAHV